MNSKIKILHWSPRLLAIASILFISLFAADAFSSEFTLYRQIVGFLIHMIPSIVLLAMLLISWKRELLGGVVYCVTGLISSIYVFYGNYSNNGSVLNSLMIISIITFPLIVVGGLFIASHFVKKNCHKLSSKTG